jgi:ligand-binding sensor domain-containing protein/class 3 adenylate cyclase
MHRPLLYISLLVLLVISILSYSCNTEELKKIEDPAQKTSSILIIDSSAKRFLGAPIKIKAGAPIISTFTNPTTFNLKPNFGIAGGFSSMKSYTSEDGLAMDVLSSSFKSSDGTLWFGTLGGGVSSFDGQEFVTYTKSHGLANNQVFSICEDKNGALWFSTISGGVSCYDGKTIRNYTTADGLVSNNLFASAIDQTGKIWFVSKDSGISCFDGKKFTNYTEKDGLTDNEGMCIKVDSKNNIWIGTINNGISKFDGKEFHNYTSKEGLPPSAINTITEDQSGRIWAGAYSGGVACLDGERFKTYTTEDGLSVNSIICSYKDKSGKLWFGTDGGGVSCFDGKSFINFTTEQGLANNSVFSIVEDNANRLWFSTYGGGVSRFDGFSIVNYTVKQGLPYNNLLGIEEDDSGNLWFGTIANGVVKFNGNSFTNFNQNSGFKGSTVSNICKDRKGNIWFGSDDEGVICYNGNKSLQYKVDQGLCSNYIMGCFEDSKGNMWFSSIDNGISCFTGDTFINYSIDQGLASNMIFSIAEDKKGAMWFGSYGNGISCINGDSIFHYSTKNGLSGDNVFCLKFDHNGNLWAGTDETGISILKNDRNFYSPGKTSISHLNTRNGLVNNTITQIIQLPNSRMIIGTNLGLMFFDFPNLSNKIDLKNIEIYNSREGYPIKDVNVGQNAMFVDSKNVLWVSTGSDKTGLVRFDLNAHKLRNKAPSLRIKQLKINNTDVVWNNLKNHPGSKDSISFAAQNTEEQLLFNRTLTAVERIELKDRFSEIQFSEIENFNHLPIDLILPFKHNNITLEFAAIEPAQPNQVQYQYILEGYDKDWNPPSNSVKASFGNIFEGNYTFKVRTRFVGNATNSAQKWSEPVNFSFTILPPWYRTWWAYLTFAILFILVVYLLIKWRERKLKAENEKLEQTVVIRTAEVVAEKKKSDDLLLNILPEEVAEELKAKGTAEAKLIDEVTVLFTDFKGFTSISEKLSPKDLVSDIHECFSAFDRIIEKHGIEKIKTIGDAYMAAGGLPVPNTTHAIDVVNAALEIAKFVEEGKAKKISENKPYFEIRIGVHTGPVVAGIVGVKKFAYDIWGDTVNTASRMESSGEAGKVNISETTYDMVKGRFNCLHRGKIQAKNKGEMSMYFIERIIS